MKIKSFTVNNYRSIKTANSISIGDRCVIIGPNNEGKSNILQGLALCLSTITEGYKRTIRRTPNYRSRFVNRSLRYDWERDYPVDLQISDPNAESTFKIVFVFNDLELKEFNTLLKVKTNNEIQIQLKFGNTSFSLESNLPKQKGEKEKIEIAKIFEYFQKRLSFHYIPAIRPTEYSIDIIEGLLEEAFIELDHNNEYTQALKLLEKLQKPILTEVGKQLTNSIKEFIPEVKKVEVTTGDTIGRAISRSLSVFVEDSAKTDIEQKGDGIKSLIAISLVNHIHSKSADRSMILALEEPESHLHPGAIHRLNKIINDISSKQQVIITTHSPLLVDRTEITRNVLVNKQNAEQAKSISSIRETIGVHVSDNLTNSSWVLLVEGKSDEIILNTWLCKDNQIKKLIDDCILTIESLGGGSNFSYKISLFNFMLCNVIFLLDDDECGKKSFEEARRKSLIDVKDGVFTIVPGRKESEIEDMIVVDIYQEEIFNKYGVNLSLNKFSKSKKKWSDKVKEAFRNSGKQWDDKIEEEIKILVAQCVKSFDGETIKKKVDGPINNLISIIKTDCLQKEK